MKVLVIVLLIGLTFIFNTKTNTGMVYLNNAVGHGLILIDPNSGTMRIYKATEIGVDNITQGLSKWLEDKDENFLKNVKAFINPLKE